MFGILLNVLIIGVTCGQAGARLEADTPGMESRVSPSRSESASNASSLVGPIHWTLLQIPTTENLLQPQILREGLGFVVTQFGNLLKFDGSKWRQLPPCGAYTIHTFYAVAEDEIWASVKAPDLYRELLFRYDGREWQGMESPNLNNIRAIYFNGPDDGWIGGEYGELYHYNGKTWQREQTPVFLHINQFARRGNGDLLAAAEAPEQSALLWRRDDRWQLVTDDFGGGHFFAAGPHDVVVALIGLGSQYTPLRANIPPFKVWKLGARMLDFLPDGSGYAVQEDSLFYFDEEGFHFVRAGLTLSQAMDIFSTTFSWIVGGHGTVMAASESPPADDPKPVYGQPHPMVLDHQKVYGIGILQQSPGKPRYVMLAKSEGPNAVLGLEGWQKSNMVLAQADSAAILNLEGSLYYAPSESLRTVGKLTVFDQGIVVGDLNNDGREDVIVNSLYGHPEVRLNSGRDYFFDATGYAGLLESGSVRPARTGPTKPALNDVDHDGDLDLFMSCQYSSNSLLVNDGYGRFREVTEAAGLQTAGGGMSAIFVDIDNDGWDDLYVAHTNGPNRLYRNLGPDVVTGAPRFADWSARGGGACWDKLDETTCVAAGDYDNDGDFDLVVFTGLSDTRLLVNDGAGRFSAIARPIVLPENAIARAAAFLDFDNDGYLDLIVASHGPNALFWGSATHELTREPRDTYANLPAYDTMNYQNRPGQLSSSVALVDVGRDLDLDVLIGNYETGSFFLRNELLLRQRGIQIFPEGVVSNRSAIGAKVFLYDGGHVGEAAHLLGVRSIQAGTGGGSSDEKVAHFGVGADGIYDARVVFPSGVVREARGLRGGTRLVVREAQGFGAAVQMLGLGVRNFVWGYRSELRLYQLVVLVLMMGVGFFIGGRYWLWSRAEVVAFCVVMLVSFAASSLLVFYKSDRQFFLSPLVVSVVGGLAVIAVDRFRGLYEGRGASFEALQNRLSAFGHGTLTSDVMNGMLMYAVNLRESGQLNAVQVKGLMETADELVAVVGAEVQAILSYLRATHFAMDKAARLGKTWRFLRLCVERLRREGTAARRAGLEGIRQAIPRLKEEVRELQDQLEEFFSCSVAESIGSAVRRYQKDGKVVLFAAPVEQLPLVRFRWGDLVYLVDELISNALAASNGSVAKIDVRCFRRFDEVMIDVCDDGPGIAREIWEEIFKEGYSTKPGSLRGGFGLYHARRTVERYGGQIYVHESEVGKGTVMRLCLRIAEPSRVQEKVGH